MSPDENLRTITMVVTLPPANDAAIALLATEAVSVQALAADRSAVVIESSVENPAEAAVVAWRWLVRVFPGAILHAVVATEAGLADLTILDETAEGLVSDAIGGPAEVGEWLGVSATRVRSLVAHGDGPEPWRILRSGPIWRRSDWAEVIAEGLAGSSSK